MADDNNKKPNPQFQQPNSRTTVITVILFLLVAVFVGSQFMSFSAANSNPTDNLITSEFVQAVEQGRVEKVVYAAGDYTVSGTYYPAATAGATAADAFNSAFDALNARVATLKAPDGAVLPGVGTTDLAPATLGAVHNYTSTYVGQDSLGELLARHPDTQYQVTLPSPFMQILGSLLPMLLIAA